MHANLGDATEMRAHLTLGLEYASDAGGWEAVVEPWDVHVLAQQDLSSGRAERSLRVDTKPLNVAVRALALTRTTQVSRCRKRFQLCWLGKFGCPILAVRLSRRVF